VPHRNVGKKNKGVGVESKKKKDKKIGASVEKKTSAEKGSTERGLK